MSELYNHESALFVLGCIINKPSILLDEKYPMNRYDFEPVVFHKLLFAIMENLVNQGATELDSVIMNQFVSGYALQQEIMRDNNMEDFVISIRDLAKAGNIEYYYNTLRKFTLLRDCEKENIYILDFYDMAKDEVEQRAKLDNVSIEDIISRYESKIIGLRKKFIVDNSVESMKVGDGFRELKERWKESPSFGYDISCPFLNAIARGRQKGSLHMFSAGSGGGKSTYSSGEMSYLCATEIYDRKEKNFVKSKQGYLKGLFIMTEMSMREQMQPKFISYVADVAYDKILDGSYTKEEEDRIDWATDIMEQSEIYIVNLPNFTLDSLDETIKLYKNEHGIDFVIFDYLCDNSVFYSKLSKTTGTTNRQDMALLALASTLKDLAEKYNVPLLTMSQLNGNEAINPIIDEKCIFGSKSIKNKLDLGCISMRPRNKELLEVAPLIQRHGFGADRTPNNVLHIYKARFSKYGQLLKIWRIFDLGTGRYESLFCTDENNSYIDVKKTRIERI